MQVDRAYLQASERYRQRRRGQRRECVVCTEWGDKAGARERERGKVAPVDSAPALVEVPCMGASCGKRQRKPGWAVLHQMFKCCSGGETLRMPSVLTCAATSASSRCHTPSSTEECPCTSCCRPTSRPAARPPASRPQQRPDGGPKWTNIAKDQSAGSLAARAQAPRRHRRRIEWLANPAPTL